MSAEVELLREAARVMRVRAQAVEPGTWIAELPGRGRAWVNTPGYEHAWGMHGFAPEAAHVAAIASPAVALAVADWLDHAATGFEFLPPRRHDRRALAVARAYLQRERES